MPVTRKTTLTRPSVDIPFHPDDHYTNQDGDHHTAMSEKYHLTDKIIDAHDLISDDNLTVQYFTTFDSEESLEEWRADTSLWSDAQTENYEKYFRENGITRTIEYIRE